MPAKSPQDHKQKSSQRSEVNDAPISFDFDGDSFTMKPSDATSLEFLEALEDEQLIKALRILLGREQASRLFKGRSVEQLESFFELMGEAVDAGNR